MSLPSDGHRNPFIESWGGREMHLAGAMVCVVAYLPVPDPIGDMYYPGEPNTPPSGTLPDLIWGGGYINRTTDELWFRFNFATTVYPSDDYDHFDEMLFGCIDIDLDVDLLPVFRGYSKKSELSGYLSALDIEAYVELGAMNNGFAQLLDDNGNWLGDVAVQFDNTLVTICVPLSFLPRPLGPTAEVAYAAYFYDSNQFASDVFPNGERLLGKGYLITPEPTTVAFMASAFCGWLMRRPRRR